jgi:hypothetical protein
MTTRGTIQKARSASEGYVESLARASGLCRSFRTALSHKGTGWRGKERRRC